MNQEMELALLKFMPDWFIGQIGQAPNELELWRRQFTTLTTTTIGRANPIEPGQFTVNNWAHKDWETIDIGADDCGCCSSNNSKTTRTIHCFNLALQRHWLVLPQICDHQ